MLFDEFNKLVPKIQQEPLQSTKAHLQMVPKDRIKYYDNYDYSANNPKASAVLSLFYPKEKQTYILLIVRSKYPGIHSAQISFPGGKMETSDFNLEQTALRETFEEVGISKDKIKILKQWSTLYIPPSNFLVTPFMGITSDNLALKLDTREVHQILELSLNDLLDNRLVTNAKINASYANDIEVPAFKIDNQIVWGATAMILNEIKQIISNVI